MAETLSDFGRRCRNLLVLQKETVVMRVEDAIKQVSTLPMPPKGADAALQVMLLAYAMGRLDERDATSAARS